MKKIVSYLVLFLVTIPFYCQVQSYYNGLDLTKTGNELFLELSNRITATHTGIPYTGSPIDVWDACHLADEDPDISTNVILIYGYDNTDGVFSTDRTRLKSAMAGSSYIPGRWNREHVFPKSLAKPSFGTDEPGPGTDVHNLRPADQDRNSNRGNNKFTDGSGNSHIVTSNGGWYPGDEWKGDVARIVMYMYTRYHGTGTQVSQTNCLPINVGFGTPLSVDSNMIELFLKWNAEDPVSSFEANRNEVLAGIQLNRNPFIDNPYLATLIWGGLEAEDKWWSTGSSDTEAPSAPENLVATNIAIKSFDLSWDAATDNVGIYDYSVYLNGVYLKSTSSTSTTISNLSSDTSYTITIKARDAASNYSNLSSILNVTTLVGPKILLEEYFEDCNNFKFFTYNEASDKNWECNNGMFGENNSGSYGINGYQENVPSKDWLITSSPINFDIETGEKLNFYSDATFGTSPLNLVYSVDYDGSSNPSDFTWLAVPNIATLLHDNSSSEKIYAFKNIDISTITGTVYIAFKYYSNGNPTRWTVDSFEITAENNDDIDDDGILNENDLCPNTPKGEIADANGCSNGQLDDDGDGIQNSDDLCANTPIGETVNTNGCSQSQLDDDDDGVKNNLDNCPNTPTGETVNANGCSNGQLDDDGDGIQNSDDLCANTPIGETVNTNGCSQSQLDDDNDGVKNNLDSCPNTPTGETVNANGCSNGQLDDDKDGIKNNIDECPNTPTGEAVNAKGCSQSQLDDDKDGIVNSKDTCPNTPIGEAVNATGCAQSQLDDDNDGVMNNKDLCPNSTPGSNVNANGCFTLPSNNFKIETISETCPGKNNGKIIITAQENHTYSGTLDGTKVNFNGNILTLNNLGPKSYNLCVSVSGENLEQCFVVTIEKGKTISGKSTSVSGKVSFDIEQGTAPFIVFVNDKITLETYSKTFDINANHGDLIQVKTTISCEGSISKTANFFNEIIAYPNPSKGNFEIALPIVQNEVVIELYNIQSQLISVKTYLVNYGKVQLNINNYPNGIYLVKVNLEEPVLLKIIKE